MRLNSVESISRARDRQKFHGEASPSKPPRRFSGRRPHHLPVVHGLSFSRFPRGADTDTVCLVAPSPSRNTSPLFVQFSRFKGDGHPRVTTVPPSSTANFSSFCLNGVTAVTMNLVRRKKSKHQIISVHAGILVRRKFSNFPQNLFHLRTCMFIY